jgi:OHCU decarboxylase
LSEISLDGTLARLNGLDAGAAERELATACGSPRWARAVAAARPFSTPPELFAAAGSAFAGLAREDWLEAFAAHPRIGESKPAAPTGEQAAAWSQTEQAGMAGAEAGVRARLAAGNRAYEERFGHVYLVCASGKSAAEMLALLEERLGHDAETELAIAAGEQRKITQLRLARWLDR